MSTSLPTCQNCLKPLDLWLSGDGSRGYNGDGVFCTLRCGYRWALRKIQCPAYECTMADSAEAHRQVDGVLRHSNRLMSWAVQADERQRWLVTR